MRIFEPFPISAPVGGSHRSALLRHLRPATRHMPGGCCQSNWARKRFEVCCCAHGLGTRGSCDLHGCYYAESADNMLDGFAIWLAQQRQQQWSLDRWHRWRNCRRSPGAGSGHRRRAAVAKAPAAPRRPGARQAVGKQQLLSGSQRQQREAPLLRGAGGWQPRRAAAGHVRRHDRRISRLQRRRLRWDHWTGPVLSPAFIVATPGTTSVRSNEEAGLHQCTSQNPPCVPRRSTLG